MPVDATWRLSNSPWRLCFLSKQLTTYLLTFPGVIRDFSGILEKNVKARIAVLGLIVVDIFNKINIILFILNTLKHNQDFFNSIAIKWKM